MTGDDTDRQTRLNLIGQVRKRMQKGKPNSSRGNENIARLELTGHDTKRGPGHPGPAVAPPGG